MASATKMGTAGLQGWRAKLGDAVAEPVSQRTPLTDDHVRALIGATFFALSVVYVVKTATIIAQELRDG